MDTQFDVIVVGGGLMGSATAWSLARRQRFVLLVEQFSFANRHGSSHGSARIVRRGYDDALYTSLTGQAFELWQELERESGTTLLRMLGGLEHGKARNIDAVTQHLARAGAVHEQLSAQ
jgi:glycine/D-amino acid oxidase-like deaminating enzyme